MIPSSGSGERAALRGYQFQYDHAALLCYQALVADDLDEVMLSSDEAGQVDDLIITRAGETHAYQFKHSAQPAPLTLGTLLKGRRSRSGKPRPSMIESLARGWALVSGTHGTAYVHLATTDFPSTSVKLLQGPPKRTFADLNDRVLQPLSHDEISTSDIDEEWTPVLDNLRAETGFDEDTFDSFLRHLRLDFGLRSATEGLDAQSREDIAQLSAALQKETSSRNEPARLDGHAVLALVDWGRRTDLRSRHRLPPPEAYRPLVQAEEEVSSLLDQVASGYIALIGPPGCGKSTLLDQALSGRPDRIVRYFAYVPGEATGAYGRLTSEGFLHDLAITLDRHGLRRGGALLSSDVTELARVVRRQIDQAHEEYHQTGQRTVVIVDGLDHVERDGPHDRNLLTELPKPSTVPEGVVFVVGSRTLSPLPAEAQEQVRSGQRTVDMSDIRLSADDVRSICEANEQVGPLGVQLHDRIVDLADGYPLAVSYLMNRASRSSDPDEVLADLRGAVRFDGDIRQTYAAVWATITAAADVVAVLATCARLRVDYSRADLRRHFGPAAVDAAWKAAGYLFRRVADDDWTIFHDSFREFVVTETASDYDGTVTAARESAQQSAVAVFCAGSDNPVLRWEELHHRHVSGEHEAVLELGTQEAFREQHLGLRSPDLIRDDIATVALLAAEHEELDGLVGAVLAAGEAANRRLNLDTIDLCDVLHTAGRTDEALRLAAGPRRAVRLYYAYGLAARLGHEGDFQRGRRVFDVAELDGIEARYESAPSEHRYGSAYNWGRAAPFYRGLDAVLTRAEAELARPDVDDHRPIRIPAQLHARLTESFQHLDPSVVEPVLSRLAPQKSAPGPRSDGDAVFDNIVRGVANTLAETEPARLYRQINDGDRASGLVQLADRLDRLVDRTIAEAGETDTELLEALDTVLASDASGGTVQAVEADGPVEELLDELGSYNGCDGRIAALLALRADVARRIVDVSNDPMQRLQAATAAIETARGRPLQYRSFFELAELAIDFDLDAADRLLAALPYRHAISVDEFGPSHEFGVGRPGATPWLKRVRYWTLRARRNLQAERGSPTPLESIPAGSTNNPDARFYPGRQSRRWQLAEHLDRLAIDVAIVRAHAEESGALDPHVVRDLAVGLLGTAQEIHTGGDDLHGFRACIGELVSYATELTVQVGDEEALSQRLAERFNDDPNFLPLRALTEATAELGHSGDSSAELRRSVLVLAEEHAEDSDASSRIDYLAELVNAYAHDNEPGRVRDLADKVVAGSFGLGFREDNRLAEAVEWLVRAAESDPTDTPTDAEQIVRFAAAVNPNSEGHPAREASRLPAAVAFADPGKAVLLLEYGSRHGGVEYTDAVARLVAQLATNTDDQEAAQSAVDLFTRVVVRASDWDRADQACDLLVAAEQAGGEPYRTDVRDTIELAVVTYAPPNTRQAWLSAIGVEQEPAAEQSEEPEDSPADRSSTQRSPKRTTIASVDDAIAFAGKSTPRGSTMDWRRLLDGLDPDTDELDALAEAFTPETADAASGLGWLAERNLRTGRHDEARLLAQRTVAAADSREWMPYWARTRVEAHRLLIDLDGESAVHDALLDFARAFAENVEFGHQFAEKLSEVLDVIAPGIDPTKVWAQFRTYLSGMIDTVELPAETAYGQDPIRWWTTHPSGDRPRHSITTSADALAQIAVDLLGHPAWTIHHAATEAVTRRLAVADEAMIRAVARTYSEDLPDDLAECLGRCLAAARRYTDRPEALEALHDIDEALGRHPNWLVRELSTVGEIPTETPHSRRYELHLPPPAAPGPDPHSDGQWLGPYEPFVRRLARLARIDPGTAVRAVADDAYNHWAGLPMNDEVGAALKAAGLHHAFPSPLVFSSRAAFGRFLTEVLAITRPELPLPPPFRFFDPELVTRNADRHPSFAPDLPEAGYEQTADRWHSEIDNRLQEYASRCNPDGTVVIGAVTSARVYNWQSPAETHTCATVLGSPTSARVFLDTEHLLLDDLRARVAPTQLQEGEPLVARNSTFLFGQFPDDEWIALRPDVAGALNWAPTATPGEYTNEEGEVAARTVRWFDGHPGRGGIDLNVASMDGWAVVLTPTAATHLQDTLGNLTRVHTITRRDHDSEGTETVARLTTSLDPYVPEVEIVVRRPDRDTVITWWRDNLARFQQAGTVREAWLVGSYATAPADWERPPTDVDIALVTDTGSYVGGTGELVRDFAAEFGLDVDLVPVAQSEWEQPTHGFARDVQRKLTIRIL